LNNTQHTQNYIEERKKERRKEGKKKSRNKLAPCSGFEKDAGYSMNYILMKEQI
jgi:hypothetical protein